MSLNLDPVMTRSFSRRHTARSQKGRGTVSDRMEVDSLFEGNEIHWS